MTIHFHTGPDFRNRVQAQLRKVVANGRQQNRQELSLGLTLVTISVLFIVCQSVKLVPDLYELFCSTRGITSQSTSGQVTCHSTKFIDTLISLANLFACINSAANFLIYMLRGKKFREAFCNTYSCCLRPSLSEAGGAGGSGRSRMMVNTYELRRLNANGASPQPTTASTHTKVSINNSQWLSRTMTLTTNAEVI